MGFTDGEIGIAGCSAEKPVANPSHAADTEWGGGTVIGAAAGLTGALSGMGIPGARPPSTTSTSREARRS